MMFGIITEGACIYDVLVLFVPCCIGLSQIAEKRPLQVNKSCGCMNDLIYSRVQPVHSALFVNLAEHYLLMSSSCFIKPNVKAHPWDPVRHVFPLWQSLQKKMKNYAAVLQQKQKRQPLCHSWSVMEYFRIFLKDLNPMWCRNET